ncbi:DUF2330 domain-containing protein [Chlorogloea sp. CCALA 695]|uniref:DUF2330 domain-containing protein n=1 Tax=Chlorogloea sp. CCALA 695 TaxID=2107693 RepID=UPI000D055711|nr:DUF2330 domain-containing protein [Chlorogloea sp. CCALA 695]PSB29236.1 DUF2330 domain-containing protein [Chlorogloea sp. CCALA 695]
MFKRLSKLLIIVFIAVICFVPSAWAFCGFYVSKADAKLYNKASQVVIARDGKRTVLTMANDYQGDVKDFALVVPVPVVLKADQVRVGESKIIERLDAFSAPRLVEYFDEDPCETNYFNDSLRSAQAPAPTAQESVSRRRSDRSLGVTIEAKFTVGEYDIVVLNAKESNGLVTWLNINGYKIPKGAKQLLQPYIRQKMKFFVAKVNLAEFDKSGYEFLRPLTMAFESPKFILPIRLGMINSTNEQDLLVYILSPKGQAELTNYRTVNIPSDADVPLFVKDEFGSFYKSMFQNSYTKENKKVAFLEYAWNMGSCDPCSAEPLNPEELRKAGVFWLDSSVNSNVFLTRLHVRYSRDKFPEDLMFQETANNQFFQGRYVLHHPFNGEAKCDAGKQYQRSLPRRFEQESQTLAKLTGWKIQDIRRRNNVPVSSSIPWWRRFWF